jgi:hypothetical protein
MADKAKLSTRGQELQQFTHRPTYRLKIGQNLLTVEIKMTYVFFGEEKKRRMWDSICPLSVTLSKIYI